MQETKTLLFYSAKAYDIESFQAAKQALGVTNWQLQFNEVHLNPSTALLAKGFDGVCAFVNDDVGSSTLEGLKAQGIQTVLLRCAGFNQVDVPAAKRLGMRVFRVPAYSPHAVAEHALALLMTLNRKTHKAYNRVREGNFLLEGLVGYDVHAKTVGVVGTGKIGEIFAQLMQAMGCKVLAYDTHPKPQLEATGLLHYVDLNTLYAQSDIISLHCPLTPETQHLINHEAVGRMKPGVVLINTSRGALVETKAVLEGLKSERIGALGLDVYEEEADLFFENLSERVIHDEVFTRLLTFPNVLITGHQAFLTREALSNIATTTLQNAADAFANKASANEVL